MQNEQPRVKVQWENALKTTNALTFSERKNGVLNRAKYQSKSLKFMNQSILVVLLRQMLGGVWIPPGGNCLLP